MFFRQERVGRNGRHFTMVKLRSMYLDAERRKAELEQQNENADGLWFKMLVKPGITGLRQISGRNDLSWQETVQLDLRYVENWTLGYDR